MRPKYLYRNFYFLISLILPTIQTEEVPTTFTTFNQSPACSPSASMIPGGWRPVFRRTEHCRLWAAWVRVKIFFRDVMWWVLTRIRWIGGIWESLIGMLLLWNKKEKWNWGDFRVDTWSWWFISRDAIEPVIEQQTSKMWGWNLFSYKRWLWFGHVCYEASSWSLYSYVQVLACTHWAEFSERFTKSLHHP